ncbi:MAG TPA: hypothetical protein VGB67_00285 [Fibrella sp.]|jgi:hypothetical protein
MTAKVRELAEKLLALAKQGVGGEKENAEAALNRHLQKHGLTIADIEGEEMTELQLPWELQSTDKIPSMYNIFQMQILINVIGNKRMMGSRHVRLHSPDSESGKAGFNVFMCTKAEAVEIEAKLDFYWKDFAEQQRVFFIAFVQKNKLYDTKAEREQMVDQDLARKIHRMSGIIDSKSFHKQLK